MTLDVGLQETIRHATSVTAVTTDPTLVNVHTEGDAATDPAGSDVSAPAASASPSASAVAVGGLELPGAV